MVIVSILAHAEYDQMAIAKTHPTLIRFIIEFTC